MSFPKDSASLRAQRGNPGQHMLKVKGPKDYLTGSPRRAAALLAMTIFSWKRSVYFLDK